MELTRTEREALSNLPFLALLWAVDYPFDGVPRWLVVAFTLFVCAAAVIVVKGCARESRRWIRVRLSTWHARQKRKPEEGPYR